MKKPKFKVAASTTKKPNTTFSRFTATPRLGTLASYGAGAVGLGRTHGDADRARAFALRPGGHLGPWASCAGSATASPAEPGRHPVRPRGRVTGPPPAPAPREVSPTRTRTTRTAPQGRPPARASWGVPRVTRRARPGPAVRRSAPSGRRRGGRPEAPTTDPGLERRAVRVGPPVTDSVSP